VDAHAAAWAKFICMLCIREEKTTTRQKGIDKNPLRQGIN